MILNNFLEMWFMLLFFILLFHGQHPSDEYSIFNLAGDVCNTALQEVMETMGQLGQKLSGGDMDFCA